MSSHEIEFSSDGSKKYLHIVVVFMQLDYLKAIF